VQQLRHTIQSGQQVQVRGEPWLVTDVDRHPNAGLVTLRGIGTDNCGDIARVLTPFDRIATLAPPSRLRHRGRRRVLETAALVIESSWAWTDCRAWLGARIEPRPWQLEPARAVLSGHSRILLADAVGLGKTIQALIIAAELSSRGLARRTLVLTPPALREQWAAEMLDRFGLRAAVFDHVSLAGVVAQLPAGVNPWNTASLIVSSIDLAKRPEVRQALDAATFDLLIVDEAHHLTPASARAAIVSDLALRTPFVVLVTATPHSGDNDAYRLLCGLGQAGGESITVFRRHAKDVDPTRSRRTRVVAVAPTAAEQSLLRQTLEYAQAVWRGPGGPGAQLVAAVIARRACSSAHAALQTLERRRAILGGTPERDDQPRLPWEEDVADDDVPNHVVSAPGLADRSAEVAWLERLAGAAREAAAHSSKLAYVRRLLKRTRESVLIFSEYRDVATLAAEELSDATSVAVLHGGLAPAIRRELVRLFNRGHIRTLIATDTAGEGLNLQQHCRLVVTLELPWNPLRIEQRIGRVDRLGQRRRVHARHLVHRGSFEDRVLARLEWRRQIAAADLSADELTDADVASIVLGGAQFDPGEARSKRAVSMTPAHFSSNIIDAPCAHPSVRAHERGALLLTPGYTSVGPARRAATHVTLLFTANLVDADGRGLQQESVCIRCRTTFPGRRLGRRVARQLAGRADVSARLLATLAERASQAAHHLSPIGLRLAGRVEALRAALEARNAHVWIQGSLFDRHDEQHARARADLVARWVAHLEQHARLAAALTTTRVADPRLVAAWLDS
jgi:superfamily II DNA or RNA helicase